MNKVPELGLEILKALYKEGVLNEIMLIGSWCLPVYKQYFNNPPFISELKISAQPLRYLSILQAYPLELEFEQISVVVPEPAAFVIQKFLISDRRKISGKKQKDLVTAVDFGRFLLTNDIQLKWMATVVNDLLPKWKKKLLRVMKEYSQEFYMDFIESLGLSS